jgi:hypothetical protein
MAFGVRKNIEQGVMKKKEEETKEGQMPRAHFKT